MTEYIIRNHRKILLFVICVLSIIVVFLTVTTQKASSTKKVDLNNFMDEDLLVVDSAEFPLDDELQYYRKKKELLGYLDNVRKSHDELVIVEHQVMPGENVFLIAKQYNADVATVQAVNNLSRRAVLKKNVFLKIPNKKGLVHRVRPGQTLWDISRAYKVKMDNIYDFNTMKKSEVIIAGTRLFVEGGTPINDNYYEIGGRHMFVLPIMGKYSSGYGYRMHPVLRRIAFHTGIDIAAGHGTKVYSARAGRVTFSGSLGGYGKMVVIRHDNGFSTCYSHNSRNLVRVGQWVKQGQLIARVGSTGMTTGPHLHFEIRKNGVSQNPVKIFRKHSRNCLALLR